MAHRHCHGILVIPVSALLASVLENKNKHYLENIFYIIFCLFRKYKYIILNYINASVTFQHGGQLFI
jgi:hypothetical protein